MKDRLLTSLPFDVTSERVEVDGPKDGLVLSCACSAFFSFADTSSTADLVGVGVVSPSRSLSFS
jgi:hypothetical protein